MDLIRPETVRNLFNGVEMLMNARSTYRQLAQIEDPTMAEATMQEQAAQDIKNLEMELVNKVVQAYISG
jgi:hypothetical protein